MKRQQSIWHIDTQKVLSKWQLLLCVPSYLYVSLPVLSVGSTKSKTQSLSFRAYGLKEIPLLHCHMVGTGCSNSSITGTQLVGFVVAHGRGPAGKSWGARFQQRTSAKALTGFMSTLGAESLSPACCPASPCLQQDLCQLVPSLVPERTHMNSIGHLTHCCPAGSMPKRILTQIHKSGARGLSGRIRSHG